MLPPWARDYIGVPFLDHGRSTLGWDCWGLVWYVERIHFGKELPSFADGYHRAAATEETARLIDTARPLVDARLVGVPVPGNVVVMRYQGYACHVGVFLGDGQVLHVLRGTGTVIERVGSSRMSARVEGYYRV
jgi:probable lipoprotein NlpC